MPPYIFNHVTESSILFLNKIRFCSYSKKASGWITLTGSIITGSVLSYYLYSKTDFEWLRNTFTGRSHIGNDVPVKKEEVYENKYYGDYDEMECVDLEEDYVKSLRNNVLYESTPKGGIVMYYDFEKESFIYYCDTKDVSYLFLETVSRKYAVTYNCKEIVVDMKHQLKLAKEQISNKRAKTNEMDKDNDKENDKNNMFATFKNYNRKGSGGSTTINKKFVLRQQANRYSYGGKVSAFSPLRTDDYKIEKPMDAMNYDTFKKLMAKKN